MIYFFAVPSFMALAKTFNKKALHYKKIITFEPCVRVGRWTFGEIVHDTIDNTNSLLSFSSLVLFLPSLSFFPFFFYFSFFSLFFFFLFFFFFFFFFFFS